MLASFSSFFFEYFFALIVLIGLAGVGGFTLLPFHKRFPYLVLMSPAAGLLILTVGVRLFL